MAKRLSWLALSLFWVFSLQPVYAQEKCRRIVSLSPALTETVYALGLGEKLAGVTRYCRYPPEAQQKAKVGGLMDLNSEALLALRPDTVLAPQELDQQLKNLSGFDLQIEFFDQHSVSAILEGIKKLGDLCGRPEQAGALIRDLKQRMAAVQSTVTRKPAITTLIVIRDTDPVGDTLKGLFISGQDGFYDELLQLSGGLNAYRGPTSSLPALSVEGLLALDPEVIIEINPACAGPACERVLPDFNSAPWKAWPRLKAIKKRQVFLLSGDYAVIPGPRFVNLLEKFAAILRAAEEQESPGNSF